MHRNETLTSEYDSVRSAVYSETNKGIILTIFLGRIAGFIAFAKETMMLRH